MERQCVSEKLWFEGTLGIEAGAPLPKAETRQEFMRAYAEASNRRLNAPRDGGAYARIHPAPIR